MAAALGRLDEIGTNRSFIRSSIRPAACVGHRRPLFALCNRPSAPIRSAARLASWLASLSVSRSVGRPASHCVSLASKKQ